jgi:hypothetical protein
METFNSAHDLCSVESGTFLGEFHVFSEMPEKLAAIKEVHDEVQLLVCLECVIQVDDEWILNFF